MSSLIFSPPPLMWGGEGVDGLFCFWYGCVLVAALAQLVEQGALKLRVPKRKLLE